MLLTRGTTMQEMMNDRYSLTKPNIYNSQKYIRFSNMIIQRPSLNLVHEKTRQEKFLEAINTGLTPQTNPMSENNADFMKQTLNLNQVLRDNFNDPNMSDEMIKSTIIDLINSTFSDYDQRSVNLKDRINSQLVAMFNSGALRSYLDRLAGKPINVKTLKDELTDTKKLLITIASEFTNPVDKVKFLNQLMEDKDLADEIKSTDLPPNDRTGEALRMLEEDKYSDGPADTSLAGFDSVQVIDNNPTDFTPIPAFRVPSNNLLPSPIPMGGFDDEINDEMREIANVETLGDTTIFSRLGNLFGLNDTANSSRNMDDSTAFTESVDNPDNELNSQEKITRLLYDSLREYKILKIVPINLLDESEIKENRFISVRGSQIDSQKIYKGNHAVKNIYYITRFVNTDTNYIAAKNVLNDNPVTFSKKGISEKGIMYLFQGEPTVTNLSKMIKDEAFVKLTEYMVNNNFYADEKFSNEYVIRNGE